MSRTPCGQQCVSRQPHIALIFGEIPQHFERFRAQLYLDKISIQTASRQIKREIIKEINNAFRDRSELLELISYYESQGMHGVGVSLTYSLLMAQVIVPKYSATLGFPDEKISPLNGNHLEIAKYSSKQDNNFIRVSKHIARLVQKLHTPQLLPMETM